MLNEINNIRFNTWKNLRLTHATFKKFAMMSFVLFSLIAIVSLVAFNSVFSLLSIVIGALLVFWFLGEEISYKMWIAENRNQRSCLMA